MARAKKGGLGRGLDSLIPIGIMEETEEVEREVADRKAARAKAAKLAKESKKASEETGKNLKEKEESVKNSKTLDSQVPAPQVSEPQVSEPQVSEPQVSASQISELQISESQISDIQTPDSHIPESPIPDSKPASQMMSTDEADLKRMEKTLDIEGKDGHSAQNAKSVQTAENANGVQAVQSAKEKEKGKQLSGTAMVRLSEIEPNREQPRKDFNEDALQELAESIRLHGVIQPLIVQKKGEYYSIIAGERRWRAAKIAGLKEVPVIIREYTDREVMEISLIENIQREDLNAIEEAKAYQRLIQEFHLKQEDIAVKISKSRAAIANTMRLLKLDERVQTMLIEEEISSGHARALLPLEDGDLQYNAAQKIASESLSVRETEKLVKMLLTPPKEPDETKKEPERDDSFIYQALEEKMKSIMGTKVSIHKKDNNKGRIEIEYYSPEELERIVELFETIK